MQTEEVTGRGNEACEQNNNNIPDTQSVSSAALACNQTLTENQTEGEISSVHQCSDCKAKPSVL